MDFYITQIKTWLLPIALGLECLGWFTNNWVCWGKKKRKHLSQILQANRLQTVLQITQRPAETFNKLKKKLRPFDTQPVTLLLPQKSSVTSKPQFETCYLMQLILFMNWKKKINLRFGEETTVCNKSKRKCLFALAVLELTAGDFTRVYVTKWGALSQHQETFLDTPVTKSSKLTQDRGQHRLPAPVQTWGSHQLATVGTSLLPQLLLLGLAMLRPGEWQAHPWYN